MVRFPNTPVHKNLIQLRIINQALDFTLTGPLQFVPSHSNNKQNNIKQNAANY